MKPRSLGISAFVNTFLNLKPDSIVELSSVIKFKSMAELLEEIKVADEAKTAKENAEAMQQFLNRKYKRGRQDVR